MFSSFFFICLTILPLARCSTFLNPAFARYGTCREQTLSDDAAVKNYVPYATMALNSEKEKGYLGTIGILGGAVANTGPAYFAAMAALRVGADAVHIFCTNAVGLALQSLGPDIVVHPLIDVNHDLLMKRIEDMDVVVIGPGMPKEYGASAAVIYRVIEYCKASKKPIVLDLDPIFLTASTLTHLQNYPSPGFIMIMNGNEFEVFYKLIKSPNSFSDGHIDVDFKKIGENFLIYRKGCTDTAFSTSLASSWSYSVTSSPRRTAGQGSIIAGASAVYFHWAIETLSANSTRMKVPMLPAAVATYQSARLMRDINSAAFQSKNRGAITSDMLKEIPNFLYGLTAELEV